MPRASYRVVDEEPLGERAAVMGTGRADREDLLAAACQQHRLLADMSEEQGAVDELRKRDPRREIRSARLRLSSAHRSILPSFGCFGPGERSRPAPDGAVERVRESD